MSQRNSAPSVFLITTDGLRWQEVFEGADSLLINDPRFTIDTAACKHRFWDAAPEVRRRKLMPFFWRLMDCEGQAWGNRKMKSRVQVKNLYKVSLPGYSELLCGFADSRIRRNLPRRVNNETILDYLYQQPDFHQRVAAFGSWEMLPYVLNAPGTTYYQDFGPDSNGLNMPEDGERVPNTGCRLDRLTAERARAYIATHLPRLVFLSFGETDEYAHRKRYDLYLHAIHQFDSLLSLVWTDLQAHPFYRNQVTWLLTTDHGRGLKTNTWNSHRSLAAGSGQIWMGLAGRGIAPLGEIKNHKRIYQNQFAATVAQLLGYSYETERMTGRAIRFRSIEADNAHTAPIISPGTTPAGSTGFHSQ